MLAASYQGLLRVHGSSWERDAQAPSELQQLAFAADGALWLAKRTPFAYDPSQARWRPLDRPTPQASPQPTPAPQP